MILPLPSNGAPGSEDLHGRAAIFPPNSAPRHVLNCAWSEGKCLACGDNGYLYVFEVRWVSSEYTRELAEGRPKVADIFLHFFARCKL